MQTCRIAILDLQVVSVEIQTLLSNQVFLAWENAEYGIEGVAVYHYLAPKGFEHNVGFGILFNNDWSAPDTKIFIQFQNNSGSWMDFFI